MKEKTYYLIPQDIIGFNRVPLDGISNLDGSNILKNAPLIEEDILHLDKQTFSIDVNLITLNEIHRNILREHFSIKVIPFQLAFKVTIKTERDIYSREINEFEMDFRKYLVFSIILANRNMKIYYHSRGNFEISNFEFLGNDGQGVFLPYSFIKLTDDNMINTFYQSDYDRTVLNHSYFYCRFESEEINNLKELLQKFIVNNERNIKDPAIDMFIHIHTFSWIPKGLFYSAVVILFSFFDSLLGKSGRISLCNSNPLLMKFKKFRDAIAHLDGHNITLNGKNYTSEQFINLRGQQVNPPEITTININEIEEVRKLIIEKVYEKINQQ